MNRGLTTRRLMLIVFVTGLGMSAFVPVSPLGCFVASVLVLATLRTLERRRRIQDYGGGPGADYTFRYFATSTLVASVLIVPPLSLAFLLLALGLSSHPSRSEAIAAILLASALVLPFVILLRKVMW